jgi:hypothetical protein
LSGGGAGGVLATALAELRTGTCADCPPRASKLIDNPKPKHPKATTTVTQIGEPEGGTGGRFDGDTGAGTDG